MSSQRQPADIFLQSMISAVALFLGGIYLLFLAHERREDMLQITGPLLTIQRELTDHPNRHIGKPRYLQIGGYNKYFEVFVGKDPGDFSPTLERIDSLRKGDMVTIYFVENDLSSEASQDESINRLAQYIEQDGRVYFVHGSGMKYIGYFVLTISICLIISLLIFKKKGIVA